MFFILLFAKQGYPSMHLNSNNASKSVNEFVISAPSLLNTPKLPVNNIVFFRYHNGIDESNVSISGPSNPLAYGKFSKNHFEGFAGINGYFSSFTYKLPDSRVIIESLPFRAPPFFC